MRSRCSSQSRQSPRAVHSLSSSLERLGFSQVRFEAVGEANEGAFDLLRRRRVCNQALHGLFQRVARVGKGLLLAQHRGEEEVAAVPESEIVARGRTGLLRFHQPLVQPSGRRVAKDVDRQRDGCEVRVGRGRRVIPGQGELIVPHAPDRDLALAVLRRLRRVIERQRRFRPRNGAEMLVDEVDGLLLGDLARHDQHCIVRPVERSVEGLQPVDRDVLHVGAGAQNGLAVVVPFECGCHHPLRQHRGGVVFLALQLVAHDGHLAVQVLLGDEGVDHAIRFQLQRPFQVLLGCGEDAVVVGPVVVRRRVCLHPAVAELLPDVEMLGRALEEQVLQQMCHARLAVALVARADQVGEVDGYDLFGLVREQQHPQAVRQVVFRDTLDRRHALDAGRQLDA